ncbi:MAG: NTP transferase domain-containing protein [Dehalococcoidia bacterium]|nr:NTP transferase domain-containing protein [Dehalococcoidia bacterium]
MGIAALIIAAGKTPRRNGFEPLKEVGTIPTIQRVVKVFRRASIERIVVVCDRADYSTEKLASRMNTVFLHSPKDAEMLDSIKVGLNYLVDKCTAVLITHVDIPFFSVNTVRLLMNTEKPIGIPSFQGSKGHPIFLQAAHFQSVLSYTGDNGLSGALSASNLKHNYVEVDDEGIIIDTQRQDGLEKLLSNSNNLGKFFPEIQIRIAKEREFYGPGTHQLLKLIDETSSLSEACRQMGISLSKGRTMIALINQQLGRRIIRSKTGSLSGGKAGGFSILTKAGKELMHKYALLNAETKQSVNEIFAKYF